MGERTAEESGRGMMEDYCGRRLIRVRSECERWREGGGGEDEEGGKVEQRGKVVWVEGGSKCR